MFEDRCPFCRRRFTASSPLALNERLIDHISGEHVDTDDAISWNEEVSDGGSET